MKKIVFYGAKALALSMYEAIRFLYPDTPCIGFAVSSLDKNPATLCGQKVWELKELKRSLTPKEREAIRVLVATPEDIHKEIADYLEENGFLDYICMDSRREAVLMERYFTRKGSFLPLHGLACGKGRAKLCVYQAKSFRDRPLDKDCGTAGWILPLQAGAALTEERVCVRRDDQGMGISGKNANYCELTALYWIWKNQLCAADGHAGAEYYGLFHYRRILDIMDADLYRLKENDVDVVLQFPTLHEPDISEHHARYMAETDWEAMLQALGELQPAYAVSFPKILGQPYFYNYNLVIAKKEVLADYCGWLFPILERTEEISVPKGWERADRYIGYLGENLMTLYFLYHRKDLKIYHTGRLMLT